MLCFRQIFVLGVDSGLLAVHDFDRLLGVVDGRFLACASVGCLLARNWGASRLGMRLCSLHLLLARRSGLGFRVRVLVLIYVAKELLDRGAGCGLLLLCALRA